MAYTDENFKTKKALREAFESGREVTVYQPGPFGPEVRDGNVALEGPHYPAAHTWYASGVVRSGVLVKLQGAKAPPGLARTRPTHPRSRGERIHIETRLTRRSGRRRYRSR